MVRGVVFPYAGGGVAAAMTLGFGRAVGEAIAVALVLGDGLGIHVNLFDTGQTLGGKIALNYQGSGSGLETASLIYLALILLVFSIVVNLLAQYIVRRAARRKGLTG
jgi:phosphate transport system permease protein